MNDKVETSRINVVISKAVQGYYKSEAERYNLPYTNYMAMILTRIYENDLLYNKNNENTEK